MNLSGTVRKPGAVNYSGGVKAAPFGSVPYVHFLEPSFAETGGAPLTLHVRGVGFQNGDKIIFNGGEEPTVFVSATELTTGVDPSTASPGTRAVPIQVKRGALAPSRAVEFAFVDTPGDPEVPSGGGEVAARPA